MIIMQLEHTIKRLSRSGRKQMCVVWKASDERYDHRHPPAPSEALGMCLRSTPHTDAVSERLFVI